MSEKYDPNYDGKEEAIQLREEINNERTVEYEDSDEDDDWEEPTVSYEQPWLNDEDFF